jgi:hypothetical protein
VTILRLAALAGGLMVASWLILLLLARRLPPGLLKDLAGFLRCVCGHRPALAP